MSVEVAPRKVSNLLRELFGRGVKVEASGGLTSTSEPRWVAVYSTTEGTPVAICVCDLGFAAHAGAALCLIPPATAQQSVASKRLEPLLLENLKEILNVCSQLFIGNEAPRVILQSVEPAAQSAEAMRLMEAPRLRADMKVSIEGYGDGKLSFFN